MNALPALSKYFKWSWPRDFFPSLPAAQLLQISVIWLICRLLKDWHIGIFAHKQPRGGECDN
jgi:hypothetical protein